MPQRVTERCRLSLLTNSALVYESAGSQLYSCAHHGTWSPNKLWRSTSIYNLRLPVSVMRGVKDSTHMCGRYRQVADSAYGRVSTPRICDSEESIFGYVYLREYEAKIKKAPGIMLGTYAEPFYIKNPKIHLLVGSYNLKTELLLLNQQIKVLFGKKNQFLAVVFAWFIGDAGERGQ
jgi:hypothetical protein